MTTVDLLVGAEEAGDRLDSFVARKTGISRAVAARLIGEGAVSVSGVPAQKSMRVEEGMRVEATIPSDEQVAPQPEAIDIPIVYEDDDLLVISKPAGLVVHPAPGHTSGTVVNALLARAEQPAGGAADRPGIVHRLDAGTSGLMVVAKNERVHDLLVEAMAARQVTRVYRVLVDGVPTTDTLTIDAPIGRSARHRKRMAVVATGKEARTEVGVLERFRDASLLEARPVTGRTHQIRVHLAAAGHPVVGDPVYGSKRKLAAEIGLSRPFLHAFRLMFTHPVSAEQIELEDPLPTDLAEALSRARER